MTTPPPGPQTPLTGGANAGGPTGPAQSVINQVTQNLRNKIATNNLAINNTNVTKGVTNTGLVNPPPLRTYVYSPEVRIVIGHGPFEYDVSADLVRCTLIRPENSAASFLFTLQNRGLRYTVNPDSRVPFLSRMDRIVVYMKKTGWIQVFSGYLDTVPYTQLYPGEINFKATCTLKRLMHTWFNPALPQSINLLDQSTTPEAMLQGDGNGSGDTGMGSLLRRVLMQIGGWLPQDIHIQNFPENFFKFMEFQIQLEQQQDAPSVYKLKQMLLGGDTSPGPGSFAGASSDAGVAGPSVGASGVGGWATSLTDTSTAFYITQIVAACDSRGLGPQVSDNNLGANISQAGAAGVAASSRDAEAWKLVQQTGQALQNTNRNTDGAILGAACAMVETGGGTTIRNLYNPAVPGSETFPNDGSGTNGTSCGIFQQQNYAEWGDVSQRMNPLQAASMFFSHLNDVSGWRDMDAGQAIQQVQRSSDTSGSIYDAAIPQATSLVQAYRTSGGAQTSTAMPGGNVTLGTNVPAAASSATAAAAGAGGNPSAAPAAALGAVNSTPGVAGTTASAAPSRATGPQPDSEGAINFAMTQQGRPYVWSAAGPSSYDCSGLVNAAFRSIGVYVPHQTNSIRDSIPQVYPNSAIQRGDLMEPHTNHVVIWLGNNMIIEATEPAVAMHANPYGPPTNWTWVGRACQNGGTNPSAAFNAPWAMGPGNPPSALAQTGGPLGTGSGGSSEPVSRNLFSYLFTPATFATQVAMLWPADKAFLDGQPLMQMVTAICQAGLRSFSSAPDGSFMAWYPDYFGVDGKPAVVHLDDLELKDVHIDFSDDAMTTHVYVNGDYSMMGDSDQIIGWMDTAGVATVEEPWLYMRLAQVAPAELDIVGGEALMRRFGIRPLKHTAMMAGTHELEFLLACQLFMQKWAEQYQTTITMTFMPELFPGMRVELTNHNLQIYVTQVTHTCDYSQGFATAAVIMAPSNPNSLQAMLTVQTPALNVQDPQNQSWLRAFASPGNVTGDPNAGGIPIPGFQG